MAANTNAIFSRLGDIQWLTLTTQHTEMDGTTASLLFTSDATNGGRIERIQAKALGSNVASVLRIFINNGLTPATAANNTLVGEVSLPVTTATAAAAINPITFPHSNDIAFPLVLPPGYRLYAALGTTVAAGWQVTAIGGKY
jgi:hypothetical protein